MKMSAGANFLLVLIGAFSLGSLWSLYLLLSLGWKRHNGEEREWSEYYGAKLLRFLAFAFFVSILGWLVSTYMKNKPEKMTLERSFSEEVTTVDLSTFKKATHDIPKGLYAGMHYGAATTGNIGAPEELVSYLAPLLDNTKTQAVPGSNIVFHLRKKPTEETMNKVIEIILSSVPPSERKNVIVVSQQGPGKENAIYAVLDKGIDFQDTANYPDVLSTIYRNP